MSLSRMPKQGPQTEHGCVPRVPKHCMAMKQILSIPELAEKFPEQFPYSGHTGSSTGGSSSHQHHFGAVRPRVLWVRV